MSEDYDALRDRLRDLDLPPVEVARAGHAEGLRPIRVIQLVREVCGVPLVEAIDAMSETVPTS